MAAFLAHVNSRLSGWAEAATAGHPWRLLGSIAAGALVAAGILITGGRTYHSTALVAVERSGPAAQGSGGATPSLRAVVIDALDREALGGLVRELRLYSDLPAASNRVDRLLADLDVREHAASVARVSYGAADPAVAQQATRRIAHLLVAASQPKSSGDAASLDRLDAEIARAAEDVRSQQQKAADFASRHAGERVTQLPAYAAGIRRAQEQLASARDALMQLRDRRRELEAQASAAGTTPAAAGATGVSADLTGQLAAVDARVQEATNEQARLEQLIRRYTAQMAGVPRTEAALAELSAGTDRARERHDRLVARRAAAVAPKAPPVRFQIAADASLPRMPSVPPARLAAAAAAFAGIPIGLWFVTTRGGSRTTEVLLEHVLERHSRVPVLAAIPYVVPAAAPGVKPRRTLGADV
jgi:uncharacterized protein involved in exopolysaccharide biosynthesis